jgi:glutamate synthase (NADPH/NADH) large chain
MTGGTVMVLGPTGRNLGAGMSGGTAYVLDLRPSAMNVAAVAAGDLEVGPLDDADWETVQDLLRRHAEETGSNVAQALLADDGARARFSRVLPLGWARVRKALAQAEAEGVHLGENDADWDEDAWNKIVEVARG